jgi:glycyl-tRNA synthetase
MSGNPPNFQDMIMRLERFWADQGCVIWQPYSEKLGAGTANPATTLRVLGPEPWNVGYVEPSYRPDDGRFAENPNRMQMHTQYQVILKPDPGNPQEMYLQSLAAMGIDLAAHDVRFVEDNWESPALGAWGLGWEVWLDGLEITQFTYFQQAGGLDLDPVAVEITYGLERIAMFLQSAQEVWDLQWNDERTYGDALRLPEVEHCEYAFNVADVDRLRLMYDLYEAESMAASERGLVIPAYDYVLKCSHTFNILDTRGAVGVTERANFFRRMRDMSRRVAEAYVEQRQRLEFPFLPDDAPSFSTDDRPAVATPTPIAGAAADLVLEIGVEELPHKDLRAAIEQLREAAGAALTQARLDCAGLSVTGTPRRVVLYVEALSGEQGSEAQEFRGPPAERAFDSDGNPTRAAQGFARGKGVSVSDLEVREERGGRYVYAVSRIEGRPTYQLLPELLRGLVAGLRFGKSMRWNSSNVSFSRPLRWLLALYGDQVVPFEYANVLSGRVSRGLRPQGSPEITIRSAGSYGQDIAAAGVVLDQDARGDQISAGLRELSASVGGRVPEDDALLQEVTDLVEQPLPLLGRFDPSFLSVPTPALVTVMKKHQRYFPVVDEAGEMLPHFITVANGADRDRELVTRGNEAVIRARYADAAYFVRDDSKKPLQDFNQRLETLTFQEELGSMLDKVRRLEKLTPAMADAVGLSLEERELSSRAALLSKADLATSMVVEITSLQGIMGEIYALRGGEHPAVARAIREQYTVRPDEALSGPGLALNLASRLDSLVGLFAVGLAPTSSADPFGLRREALGVVQNLVHAQVSLSLRQGLEQAAALLPVVADEGVLDQVMLFIRDRLYGWMRERGLPHDVVEAVLAERSDDPYRAYTAARELARWVQQDDWSDILVAYARCKRIVRSLGERIEVAPGRYVEPATRELHAAWDDARQTVSPEGSVDVLGEALRTLVPPINRFFDQVLVMAEEPDLQAARLALVQRIAELPDGIVDLSRMQGF